MDKTFYREDKALNGFYGKAFTCDLKIVVHYSLLIVTVSRDKLLGQPTGLIIGELPGGMFHEIGRR